MPVIISHHPGTFVASGTLFSQVLWSGEEEKNKTRVCEIATPSLPALGERMGGVKAAAIAQNIMSHVALTYPLRPPPCEDSFSGWTT